MHMVTITEVFNNTPHSAEMTPAFGFSSFIHDFGILFDTGSDGDVLLANLRTAGIDIAQIEQVFLSHDHWDHVGGLDAFLSAAGRPEVVVHNRFSDGTMGLVGDRGTLRIVSEWEELSPGVASTGPLPGPPAEQSLVIDTDRGAVIITGCSHPHVSRIIAAVKEREEVFGIIGGFHDVTDDDIRAVCDLGYVSASHCTGRLDEISTCPGFVPGGVGAVHRF
ncbi:MAG: MBL fold metallo-hydrolase [Methanoculleaceae archaeon]